MLKNMWCVQWNYLFCQSFENFGKTGQKLLKMAFGDYPVEYNPKVHGVYDPARYYGKRK